MTDTRILLLEAKKQFPSSFMLDLQRKNYSVLLENSVSAASKTIKSFKPEIIVLNACSMHTSGTRMCLSLYKSYKRLNLSCKIILIVAKTPQYKQKQYVDLTLVQPITSRKLLNAVKRLSPVPEKNWRSVGPLKFSYKQRRVKCWNKEKLLNPKEARLLQTLINRSGSTVSRKHLIKQIWETDYLGDTRTLDVHISWLRRAIEKDPLNPQILKTVRGKGYFLDISNDQTK